MSSKRSPLRRLLTYLGPHSGKVWLASVFSVLNKFFDLAPPLLIGAAVDIVVRREDSILAGFGFPDPWIQFLILAGLTVFIWLMESLFEYLLDIYWRNLAQSVQHGLRTEAYAHLQKQQLSWFEDKSSGSLMSVLSDDINQLERFLDTGANDIIQITTTILLIGGMYLFLAPGIAWMAIVPMPFIVWGALWFQKKLGPRYSQVREEVGILNGQLANNLGGIATIKSFGSEDHENHRIGKLSENYREANRRAIALSSAFVPLIRILILAGFTGILIFGGAMTLGGELEVGIYSVMIFMIQRLLWPLTSLGKTFDLYQRGMASAERVLDLLDLEEELKDGSEALDRKNFQGEFELHSLDFSYRTGPPVLQKIDLSFPAGKTVGIVGATGAGKSTIVKLLSRLYDASQGRILLDGRDIQGYRMKDLAAQIGFVSQDVFLFHGTVRENIAYGSFGASEEEILQASEIAEAREFIDRLPNGFDTVVGERGQKLSGGQRQRISIARAVLRDPPILLLDEATSSVDTETEAAIQRSLLRISQNRTTIVVAHRLSTIRHADRIVVLDKGQIAEMGNHEELLSKHGIYHQLWRVQLGSSE